MVLRRHGHSDTLNCDLSGYKPVDGIKAELKASAVVLSWQGEAGQQLRAQLLSDEALLHGDAKVEKAK
jgi:hypothetical protein